MANVHTFNGSSKLQLLIVPAAQASLNTSWVSPFADGGGADRAVFLLTVGAIAGTVAMKITQATSSAGAGAKDITGAAITTVTTSTDESLNTIEIAPGALDDTNGFKWVRAEVTVVTGTPVYSVTLLKHRLRYPGIGGQDTSYRQAVIVI